MSDRIAYEPIKVPLKQKLREFRLRFLPVLVFGIVLLFVIYLWDLRVYNPSFVGVVHGEMTQISSVQSGKLQNISVEPFQAVQKGDFLAKIAVVDAQVLQSKTELLEARIEMMSLTMYPLADWQRNRINIAGLRIDAIQERIALSALKIRKDQQERNVNRIRILAEKRMKSVSELEEAELELSLIVQEIEERELHVESLENYIGEILRSDDSNPIQSDGAMRAAIRVLEKEIEVVEQELKPIQLTAPFDGIISHVFYPDGVFVSNGNPIIQIESQYPTHIIGYLRQPLTMRPEVGKIVQVRTRTPQKAIVPAVVEAVGAQISLIDPSLQRPGGPGTETGIPVKISLAGLESISLIPGEIVDIIVPAR